MDSDDMILLLFGKNLFCKKSQWSRPWNNPGGKGIRVGADGLLFGDSVVADSFTMIMWQRYSTSPSLSYGQIDDAINRLNAGKWRGFDNWRPPTIEEIMALLVPKRNRHGLFSPRRLELQCKKISGAAIPRATPFPHNGYGWHA